MPSGSHGFIPSAAGAESSVLRYFSPGKVLFVAIVVTGTWMLLKWVRGFLDGLEKHNPAFAGCLSRGLGIGCPRHWFRVAGPDRGHDDLVPGSAWEVVLS